MPTATPRVIETKLGLDLEGGIRVEYQALPKDGKTPGPGDLSTIRDIIERRVNSTGVSEPIVQTQGTDRVVVELPGVSNKEDIEKLVGQTGRLDFVPLPADEVRHLPQPGSAAGRRGPAAAHRRDAALQRRPDRKLQPDHGLRPASAPSASR